MSKRIVLLYSGGFDSSLLLSMALKVDYEPLCLLIDYGQIHIDELKYAEKFCQKLKVNHITISVTLPVASKLTDGNAVYDGVSEWHVPSRNMIFVSLAASIAESERISTIWYGPNYEDREALFPDCYQEWVYSVNKVLAINGSAPIVLEAPLLGMSKELIIRLAKSYGIDNKEVYSGYGK
jgi:7-cyano-7-deazaguanine synthase